VTAPEPAVHIGLTAIYRELMAIKEQLGPMACDLRALRETTKEGLDDLDNRVDSLEARRIPWGILGGAVGIGGLLVSVIALFVR
jgi:hypothetical protein